MTRLRQRFKHAAGTAALALALVGGAAAEERDLDDLFDALRGAEGEAARAIESRIWEEWSQSGSPSMDLLLERGRTAMEGGAIDEAVGHFTALIDHAPGFAEGYNARATAYFSQGRYGPALEDIRRTLALNPRHFGALSGLALILEELGYNDEALEAYRAVEEIYPAREGLFQAIRRLERQTGGQTL